MKKFSNIWEKSYEECTQVVKSKQNSSKILCVLSWLRPSKMRTTTVGWIIFLVCDHKSKLSTLSTLSTLNANFRRTYFHMLRKPCILSKVNSVILKIDASLIYIHTYACTYCLVYLLRTKFSVKQFRWCTKQHQTNYRYIANCGFCYQNLTQ